MSTLTELREEVRQLVGSGVYDRMMLPGGSTRWTDEGLNWACEQTAQLLGITRVDVLSSVVNKQTVVPADAVKVVFIQVR
jgi:hypothetical protein